MGGNEAKAEMSRRATRRTNERIVNARKSEHAAAPGFRRKKVLKFKLLKLTLGLGVDHVASTTWKAALK
jgi:hypothetical protein